jgi:hypothetical protein
MARIIQHNGRFIEVPDDITDEEARRRADAMAGSGEEKLVARDRIVDPSVESEGTLQELAEGLGSGVTKAVQGVAELGGIAIDSVFDTNTTRAISQAGDDVREALGLDPVGIAGTIGDVTGQFLLPGGVGVAAVSKISKLGKLEKAIRQQGRGRVATAGPMPARLTAGQTAKLRAQQAGAALLVDAAVADDGVTTIGDFVDGGPTMTEKDVGLSGRLEAGRRFRNKLRLGAEAGALAAAFPYLLSTTALVAKPGLMLTGEVLAPVASGTRGALQKIAEATGNSAAAQYIGNMTVPRTITRRAATDPDTTISDVYEGVKARLRFRGNLTTEAAERRSAIQGFIDSQANDAAYTIRQLEKETNKIFKGADTANLQGFGELSRVEVMNSIYGFLTKDANFLNSAEVRRAAIRRAARTGEAFDPNNADHLIEAIPEFARGSVLKMRQQIDDLSARIVNSDYGTQNVSQLVRDEITENFGKYLRRKYRVFDDPDAYFRSDEYVQNRREVIGFLQQNPNTARNLYNKIVSEADLGNQLATDAPVTQRVINDVVDTFVNRYRTRVGFLDNSETLSRTAKQKMSRDMFRQRRLEEDVLKKLLGEVTDPVEAYVRTVGDLAETVALDDFYGFLRQGRGQIIDGSRVGGDDIIDGNVYESLSLADRANYIELVDSGFGSLTSAGKEAGNEVRTFARKPVYNDLTRNTKQFSPLSNMAMSAFLLGKGFTQKVKTVYSPITQIRNVTSAALFAAAQGNVGRGANVFESVSLVLENIRKSSPEDRAAFFRELQELGVVGTQAQLRELERTIEDGLSRLSTDEVDQFGVNLGQKKSRGRAGQFLGSIDKRARDLYQGGDDIWKIYNFDFERSKLVNAFGGDVAAAEDFARAQGAKSLNAYAADIVKNTVPNYERVPQFIEGLRRLPVGNFIAFPAEIVRTSFNTLNRAIDEVQMGARMIQEGRAAGNQALVQQGRSMRDIGKRRLNGFAATTMVAGPAVQETALYLNDLSRDTLDALREIAPPWSKNSTLVPTSVDKDGNITGYVDYSFTNPYDYLRRPVMGVINAINDGKELDLDASSITLNAMGQFLSEVASPFAEESIIFERLLDVTARGGVTKTGNKVWNPEDTPGEVGAKSMTHIFEAFQPTIITDFASIAQVSPTTGDVEFFVPGRLGAALLGPEGLDKRGNVRQLEEEILRYFTGIGEQKVTPESSFRYRTYAHNESAVQAQRNFNRQLRAFGRTVEDPSVIIENYRQENERKFKVYNRGFKLIENMKKLGMDEREIRRAAKEFGFSGYKKILAGRFDPVNIDSDIMNDITAFYRSVGRPFDRRGLQRELNLIKRDYLRRPLTAEGVEERKRPVFRIEMPAQETQTSTAPTPPTAAVDTGAATNLPQAAAPVQPMTNQTAQSTIQDPRTRELFERLRGTG